MTNHGIFAYKTLWSIVLYFNVFGLKRSYDNSTNGINFTIRKVNLMFVFIVVVWIFFFNKYVIQNPVFFYV